MTERIAQQSLAGFASIGIQEAAGQVERVVGAARVRKRRAHMTLKTIRLTLNLIY